MQAIAITPKADALPIWFRAASAVGVAWNLFGVYQFTGSFTQTRDTLMAAGMTAAQADVYLGLPAWISLVFAIGVFGGLVGSIALALRRKAALPVLAASLAGYVLLFAGDAWHGVFASIPSQLAILAVVVLVAAALLALALWARRRAWLH